jgi:hypothetical protein
MVKLTLQVKFMFLGTFGPKGSQKGVCSPRRCLTVGFRRVNCQTRIERRIQTLGALRHFMAIERLLTGSIQNQIQELMSTEDLVIEAFRDLVKDELKSHIRAKVDEDPELKAEIKEAVAYYFHSKARSIYAELKATRAATRLGLRLLPDELQGEVGEALVTLFEKELGTLLEKAL